MAQSICMGIQATRHVVSMLHKQKNEAQRTGEMKQMSSRFPYEPLLKGQQMSVWLWVTLTVSVEQELQGKSIFLHFWSPTPDLKCISGLFYWGPDEKTMF